MNHFTMEEMEDLRDILDWWRLNQSLENEKIRFDHRDSRTCSVRLSKALYEAADLYARINPAYRSFSRMVEVMLWEKLGKDPKYLRPSGGDIDD